MEKKSLEQFLDEVSEEMGLLGGFWKNTSRNPFFDTGECMKEGGKRYVKQYLSIAAEEAGVECLPENMGYWTVSEDSIRNVNIDV